MWMLTPPQSPCCWINSLWMVSLVNLDDLFLAFDYNLIQVVSLNVNLFRAAQICTNLCTFLWIWSHFFVRLHINLFSCIQLYQSARICGIFMLFLPLTNNALPTYKQNVHCLYLPKCVEIWIHAKKFAQKKSSSLLIGVNKFASKHQNGCVSSEVFQKKKTFNFYRYTSMLVL